ncbi:hypothetical protein [Mycobacterium sp.]|nr:hypothetical protein [Mycobacterium sp.]
MDSTRSHNTDNLLLEVLQESDDLSGAQDKGVNPSPRQDVGH